MNGIDELREMLDGYTEGYMDTGTFANECERALPLLLAVVDAAEKAIACHPLVDSAIDMADALNNLWAAVDAAKTTTRAT